ncbi:alpha-galactosidase [Acidobacteriota bacterium]
MRRKLGMLGLGFVCVVGAACSQDPDSGQARDWLIAASGSQAEVRDVPEEKALVLSNGLISRTFRLAPNAASVAFDNLMTGESLLRAVRPEARVRIDGRDYAVGGLRGQPNHAYLLPEWLDGMESDPEAFRFTGHTSGGTSERFPWKRKRHSEDRPWPPPGASLTLRFEPPGQAGLQGITVLVHYEMYAGLPLLCKWLTVQNEGDTTITLEAFTSEVLAAVEGSSAVESTRGMRLPNLHVETDFAFHGMTSAGANEAVHWNPDPEYLTQVSYRRLTPCLLEVHPPLGPQSVIRPGESFQTFRTFELAFDSTDRERQGLAIRRMYRTIAPWVTENPLMMHVRRADPESVRRAVDQCAEVGFEMVILTFGSGFNIENEDPAYLEELKGLADYAHKKGIELGGYSLLASRRISDEHDVVNPETGKPGGFAAFGNSPCLGSSWGQDYFRKLYAFYERTGFDLLEHDGSYPGDVCASQSHPGHRGLEDSQYTQWQTITDFYKWCRAEGIYLNVPDFYYLGGSNKCGMGYRETNWSLPRDQQVIHTRQNIFDGTYQKTPSMGWMFVPLTEYHGGGEAATIEPLHEHRDHYGLMLAGNLGLGVQACYRGPRLYDTEETKAMVKEWVDFYKRHRAILESDLIHLRRADGRDLDYMLHVNPRLEEQGLLMVYNPLVSTVRRTLRIPLYYTGLTDTALIREQEGKPRAYRLDRAYEVRLDVQVPPSGVTWFIIGEG